MPIVKIGLATRSLRLPIRRALAAASQLGADGVEIDLRSELPLADLSQSAIRQFRKLLDDHHLRLAAASYPTRRGYEDPAELDRRLQGTRLAMKVAADLGARVLVGRAYGELPEEGTPKRDALMHALESLAQEGSRVGAQFAPLTTSAPVTELASVLQGLPEGTMGVALHPANLLAGGQTPLEALEHVGRYVSYVYATDAVRDLGARGHVEVELGRGSADLPAVLATLEARDYTGWATVERTDPADPTQELGNAVAYLRSLGR